MSDNITIKKLLDLDEAFFTKMSDITLEATVTRALKAREVKGSKDGRDYHFFSQFVVVNDNTADIGMDLVVGKAEEAFTTDTKIKIEKAKTATYKDKKGDTQRKLTKGKVMLLESAKPPQGGTGESSNKEDERKYWDHRKDKEQKIITKSGLAKSLIEAGRKWSKTVEKEADAWLGWIYNSKPEDEPKPEKKPEENTIEKIETVPGTSLDKVTDKDFNRDKLIQRLGKRFAELFVSGKTKGLGLEEWLTKNYKVKSFMALSDDYLVEIDSVFDDMFEELQKELGGKK